MEWHDLVLKAGCKPTDMTSQKWDVVIGSIKGTLRRKMAKSNVRVSEVVLARWGYVADNDYCFFHVWFDLQHCVEMTHAGIKKHTDEVFSKIIFTFKEEDDGGQK